MADQRILQNTSVTLRRTFYVDGTATDADGTVNIVITDETGDTVVASTAATSEGSGVYSYLLTPQTQLNRLTVTWSGDWSSVAQTFTDYVEVIGGHLFTEAEARNVYDGAFSSATVYTDAAIAEARDRITDEFEQICGVSFVPRYERETLMHNGGARIQTRRPRVLSIISATDNGTTVSTANLTNDQLLPYIYRTSGAWFTSTTTVPYPIVVEYTHGYQSVPGDVKRAALKLLRHQLLPDEAGGSIPDRMLSMTNEFGNMRISQPGIGRFNWYGIPTVDATLARYMHILAVA